MEVVLGDIRDPLAGAIERSTQRITMESTIVGIYHGYSVGSTLVFVTIRFVLLPLLYCNPSLHKRSESRSWKESWSVTVT
jgi:hypothetical protein